MKIASLLWVRCVECGALNSIKTSKSHVKKKGAPVYDVNTKAAGAMIHSGLSVTGLQKFMASSEVPPVNARTLKKREREIGVTIEKVAKKSFLDATELEQNLCSLNSSAANKEGVVDLKASYDMGWQRKGSDRAYNNRSGHGVFIGTESEKILTRISNCKKCEMNKVMGRVMEHDCRMNWGGSSKSMESDLAIDMFVSGTTEKARISTIFVDEDSTIMAKIKEAVPHEVTKESDINHAKKL